LGFVIVEYIGGGAMFGNLKTRHGHGNSKVVNMQLANETHSCRLEKPIYTPN